MDELTSEELRDIVARLTELAGQRDLVGRAKDVCARWLRKEADQLKLVPNDVQMQFDSHSLFFHSDLLSYPFIATRLTLSLNNREIGYYRRITLLDGSADDDYLVLDDGYLKDVSMGTAG